MEQTAVARREPINIDFAKSGGIVPQNYAEAMQMAALLYKSGLAPKTLDTQEKVAVACFMCLELGRPIMTGIQDIGVINGKAGIYGDAALALVRASGKLDLIKETEEGTPYTDNWVFRCILKRKGDPTPKEGVWTWIDAKRAGYDDPKTRQGGKDMFSPWRRYTRRMMQFKARNFVLRDTFGDVLRGIRLSEDNMDAIDMYETGNGAYASPDQEPDNSPPPASPADVGPGETEPSIDEQFKAFVQETQSLRDAEQDYLDKFLNITAEANGVTVSDLKERAMKNGGEFGKAFAQWVLQEKRKADEPQGGNIREEFINLRSAGYSTWVHKNLERIPTLSEDLQTEIREKWAKLYDERYPLDPEQAQEPQEPEEEPGPAQGLTPKPESTEKEQEEDHPFAVDYEEPTEEEPFALQPNEPAQAKPWDRRAAWLKRMEGFYDKNREIYFRKLGERGFSRAKDVPENLEDEIAKEIETEILA